MRDGNTRKVVRSYMYHTGYARPLTASWGPKVNTSVPYKPWKHDRSQKEAQHFLTLGSEQDVGVGYFLVELRMQ